MLKSDWMVWLAGFFVEQCIVQGSVIFRIDVRRLSIGKTVPVRVVSGTASNSYCDGSSSSIRDFVRATFA